MPIRIASQSSESSLVRYVQRCSSIASTVPQRYGPLLELGGRRVQRDARLEARRRGAQAGGDERRRVLGGQRARLEATAGGRGPLEPVDAKRAPVRAVAVPGDEVPAPAEVDEAVRLDDAAALLRLAAAVGEAQPLAVAARAGDRRQGLRIDHRPARGQRREHRAERVDAPAQVRRQHLLELDERADRGLLDARHGRAGGGPQADRDRDRLVVVEQQRWHRRAGMQAVASGRSGDRIHRIAQVPQPLHVAADRAARHAEPLRELVAGPVTARLQQ